MSTATMGGLGTVSGLGAAQAPIIQLGVPGLGDAAPGDMLATGAGVADTDIAGLALMGGSAISGAIVGGVAASDWRGAGTGAMALAGLTGVRLAFLPTLSRGARLAYGAVGLVGLASGILLAYKRRR